MVKLLKYEMKKQQTSRMVIGSILLVCVLGFALGMLLGREKLAAVSLAGRRIIYRRPPFDHLGICRDIPGMDRSDHGRICGSDPVKNTASECKIFRIPGSCGIFCNHYCRGEDL